MKMGFIFNSGMKLFRKNSVETIKLFLVSAIVCICFIIGTASYYIINRELSLLEKNFNFIIKFQAGIDPFDMDNYLDDIKHSRGVASINFVTSEQAKNEFTKSFGSRIDKLMKDNDFPTIATVYVSEDYQTQNKFFGLIGHFKGKEYVQQLYVDEDLIKTVIEIRNRTLLFSYIFGAGSLLIIISLVFLTLKNLFNRYKNDLSVLISLGGSKLFSIFPILIFITFTSIIGILLGICVSIILWNYLQYSFLSLKNEISSVILIGTGITFLFQILITLIISLFFVKEK